ncbi:MAG: response regulator [Polyangiales bacterium]
MDSTQAVQDPTPPRTGRILVAEHNELNAELMRELLQRRGHHTVRAHHGLEALALLERDPFDLMLLDLHMPGLDGFEVVACQRQREREQGGHLQVVALTARAEDRQRCLDAGLTDLLPKPIQGAKLWSLVDRALAAAAPIDARVLLAACGEDAAILAKVLVVLKSSLPRELARMEERWRAGDLAQLRELAHKLQGTLGAASTSAARRAIALENELLTGSLPTRARFEDLQRVTLGVLEALADVTLARLQADVQTA